MDCMGKLAACLNDVMVYNEYNLGTDNHGTSSYLCGCVVMSDAMTCHLCQSHGVWIPYFIRPVICCSGW